MAHSIQAWNWRQCIMYCIHHHLLLFLSRFFYLFPFFDWYGVTYNNLCISQNFFPLVFFIPQNTLIQTVIFLPMILSVSLMYAVKTMVCQLHWLIFYCIHGNISWWQALYIDTHRLQTKNKKLVIHGGHIVYFICFCGLFGINLLILLLLYY